VVRSTNPHGDCYCHIWESDPQFFIREGIPEGYCGRCDSIVGGKECGKPGHMRSGPGPFTTCSCDEHAGGRPIHCGCLVLGFLLVVALGVLLYFWFF
jgi:hypothetical protein